MSTSLLNGIVCCATSTVSFEASTSRQPHCATPVLHLPAALSVSPAQPRPSSRLQTIAVPRMPKHRAQAERFKARWRATPPLVCFQHNDYTELPELKPGWRRLPKGGRGCLNSGYTSHFLHPCSSLTALRMTLIALALGCTIVSVVSSCAKSVKLHGHSTSPSTFKRQTCGEKQLPRSSRTRLVRSDSSTTSQVFPAGCRGGTQLIVALPRAL